MERGHGLQHKINDLINTVTDLQIGAFINPRGTIAPNKISVDNLSYATETSEPEAGYINTSGKFSFAKLNYGDTAYGPLNIDNRRQPPERRQPERTQSPLATNRHRKTTVARRAAKTHPHCRAQRRCSPVYRQPAA